MEYTGSDFYCDVAIKGIIDLKKEYESEHVLAFHHTRPYWPTHLVVTPKRHINSFTALSEDDQAVLLELMDVIKQLASNIEKEQGAARILTNLGSYQDSKHLHFHIGSGQSLR